MGFNITNKQTSRRRRNKQTKYRKRKWKMEKKVEGWEVSSSQAKKDFFSALYKFFYEQSMNKTRQRESFTLARLASLYFQYCKKEEKTKVRYYRQSVTFLRMFLFFNVPFKNNNWSITAICARIQKLKQHKQSWKEEEEGRDIKRNIIIFRFSAFPFYVRKKNTR